MQHKGNSCKQRAACVRAPLLPRPLPGCAGVACWRTWLRPLSAPLAPRSSASWPRRVSCGSNCLHEKQRCRRGSFRAQLAGLCFNFPALLCSVARAFMHACRCRAVPLRPPRPVEPLLHNDARRRQQGQRGTARLRGMYVTHHCTSTPPPRHQPACLHARAACRGAHLAPGSSREQAALRRLTLALCRDTRPRRTCLAATTC